MRIVKHSLSTDTFKLKAFTADSKMHENITSRSIFLLIENKKMILFDILIQQPRVGSCLDNTHIFTIYGHEDKRGIGTYSVP